MSPLFSGASGFCFQAKFLMPPPGRIHKQHRAAVRNRFTGKGLDVKHIIFCGCKRFPGTFNRRMEIDCFPVFFFIIPADKPTGKHADFFPPDKIKPQQFFELTRHVQRCCFLFFTRFHSIPGRKIRHTPYRNHTRRFPFRKEFVQKTKPVICFMRHIKQMPALKPVRQLLEKSKQRYALIQQETDRVQKLPGIIKYIRQDLQPLKPEHIRKINVRTLQHFIWRT